MGASSLDVDKKEKRKNIHLKKRKKKIQRTYFLFSSRQCLTENEKITVNHVVNITWLVIPCIYREI